MFCTGKVLLQFFNTLIFFPKLRAEDGHFEARQSAQSILGKTRVASLWSLVERTGTKLILRRDWVAILWALADCTGTTLIICRSGSNTLIIGRTHRYYVDSWQRPICSTLILRGRALKYSKPKCQSIFK